MESASSQRTCTLSSLVRKRYTVVDTESAQHARTTAQTLCTVNTALNKSSAAQRDVARDCACSPHAHVCRRRHALSNLSTPTILPGAIERMSWSQGALSEHALYLPLSEKDTRSWTLRARQHARTLCHTPLHRHCAQ